MHNKDQKNSRSQNLKVMFSNEFKQPEYHKVNLKPYSNDVRYHSRRKEDRYTRSRTECLRLREVPHESV